MSGRKRTYLQKLRDEAFEEQDGLCWWCEQPMLPTTGIVGRCGSMVTAEHLIPREYGGTTSRANVVAACAKCNNGKRNYEVLELDQ